MRNSWLAILACVLLVSSAACGSDVKKTEDQRESTAAPTGTSGDASGKGATLSGCLEQNTQTGMFELVTDDSRRLPLKKGEDVELNQAVGKRVTLAGSMTELDSVYDAGTQTPIAGSGADRSQTKEGTTQGFAVTAVQSVGERCRLENR